MPVFSSPSVAVNRALLGASISDLGRKGRQECPLRMSLRVRNANRLPRIEAYRCLIDAGSNPGSRLDPEPVGSAKGPVQKWFARKK